jgi:hypothetical protein
MSVCVALFLSSLSHSYTVWRVKHGRSRWIRASDQDTGRGSAAERSQCHQPLPLCAGYEPTQVRVCVCMYFIYTLLFTFIHTHAHTHIHRQRHFSPRGRRETHTIPRLETHTTATGACVCVCVCLSYISHTHTISLSCTHSHSHTHTHTAELSGWQCQDRHDRGALSCGQQLRRDAQHAQVCVYTSV